MTDPNRVSLYLRPEQAEKLPVDARHTRSAAINVVIDRYHAVMTSLRAEVEQALTKDEMLAVCGICNGTIFEPAEIIIGAVLADVQDADDTALVQFGVGKGALCAKIADLSPAHQMALVELIEAFWRKGTA
jgi:hypothetical protein